MKNQASAATAAAIHPTIGIAEIAAVADAANPVIAVWMIANIPGIPPRPAMNVANSTTGIPTPNATIAVLSRSAAAWFSLKKLVISLINDDTFF